MTRTEADRLSATASRLARTYQLRGAADTLERASARNVKIYETPYGIRDPVEHGFSTIATPIVAVLVEYGVVRRVHVAASGSKKPRVLLEPCAGWRDAFRALLVAESIGGG